MGESRTIMPQKDSRREEQIPAPFGAKKTFSLQLAFLDRITKTGSTQELVLLTPVTPPAAAAGRFCRQLSWETPPPP